MSRLFGAEHRALQDAFDTRRVADKIEAIAVTTELSESDQASIASQDMFLLATVDENGRPTVSYKGGDPGFVKVVDAKTIAFPLYDGNGMFYSAGNVVDNANVGLLFINFENPLRMRIQGTATASVDDPLMSEFHEALMVVRVTVEEVWPNCNRYIHRRQRTEASRYVPREGTKTPLAGWKRVDIVQEDLPAKDVGRAEEEGGLITIEEWFEKAATGADDA